MARGPPPPPRPRPGRGSPSYSRTSSVTPQPSGAAPTPSEPAPPPELPGVEAGSSGPLVRARAACDTAPGADAVRQRTDGGSGRKGRGEAALTRALLAPRAAHAWPAHRMSALTAESAGRGQSVPLSAKCGRSTHERSGRPRLSQAAPSFSRHLGRPAVASGLRGRCISSNCRARRGPFPPWRSVRFRGLRKTTHHETLREQGRGVGPVCRVLEPSMAAPDSQNPGPSSSETCPSSGHPLHRHWFPGGSGRKS